MENYNTVKSLLLKVSYLGMKNVSNSKALLIGHVPQIAPDAWLNCIYEPISLKEIESIEESVGLKIPQSYKSFMLSFSNGLNILGDTISLFGYRFNYIRNSEEILWQPYDIIIPNLYERPKNATHNDFIIGGYEWDGSKLYINKDNEICYCKSEDITPLKKWNNLLGFLNNELLRLYKLIGDDGVLYDASIKTTPV